MNVGCSAIWPPHHVPETNIGYWPAMNALPASWAGMPVESVLMYLFSTHWRIVVAAFSQADQSTSPSNRW